MTPPNAAEVPSKRRLVVIVPGIQRKFDRWASLLARLKAEQAFEDSEFWPWDHKCGVTTIRDVSAIARELHAVLKAKWLKDGPYDDIILTGHSLGGILVRRAYLVGCFEAEEEDKANMTNVTSPIQEAIVGGSLTSRATDAPAADRGVRRSHWSDAVSRIILLAAVNRGANPNTRLDVRIASILGRIFPALQRLLLWQLLRGSTFITNLRIEWIRYFATTLRAKPIVVQLVGTRDTLVSREDSIDIEQLPNSYILDIPDGNHKDLFQLDGIDNPDLRYALLRDAFAHERPTLGENRKISGPENVVIIMHGIRANNKTWVKKTKDAVKQQWPSVLTIGPEHEFLSALRFAIPFTRRRHLTWFQDAYAEALAHNPNAKFAFIGHSNGTYLFGQSLKTIPGMQFERAALLASVLPREFDWQTCLLRKQIAELRVDGGNLDWPVGLLCSGLRGFGMRDIGTGGFLGFTRATALPIQEVFWHRGGHSAPIEDANIASFTSFVLEGKMTKPDARYLGDEVGWFAGLGRAMVVLGPLLVLAILAGLSYGLLFKSPSVALWSAIGLLVMLALLEFS